MIRNHRSRKFRGALLIAALIAGNAAAESLLQAWDTALAVDRGLKASRENTTAAASLLKAAKSVRLPNVALEAGHTALDNTPAAKAEFFGQSLQMPLAQKESGAYKAMATLPLLYWRTPRAQHRRCGSGPGGFTVGRNQ